MRCLTTWLFAVLAPWSLAGAQSDAYFLKIVALEGEGAINNIQMNRAKEPVVEVLDAKDAPVQNATVTFMLPEMGPSATFADHSRTLTTITDERGRAVGRGLHPNKAPGRFQIRVTASFAGQTARLDITQTNAQPAAAVRGGSSKKFLWIALAGAAAAGGAFAAMGSSSSAASPATAGNTTSGGVITPGSPSLGPPH
jgi:hypothetical protein